MYIYIYIDRGKRIDEQQKYEMMVLGTWFFDDDKFLCSKQISNVTWEGLSLVKVI